MANEGMVVERKMVIVDWWLLHGRWRIWLICAVVNKISIKIKCKEIFS